MTNPIFENFYTGHFLVSEASGNRSRDQIVIAMGSGVVPAGMVLGKQTFGAGVATPGGGNHGNGVAGAVTLQAGTQPQVGNYVLTALGALDFQVVAPDGRRLAELTVDVAYADEIGVTIAHGATAFQAGDTFTIAIAAGTGKYVPVNPAAVDGSQIAAGINYNFNVDTTAADQAATAVVRAAEVNAAELQWPAGTTAPQIAAATAQLAAAGIIAR